MDKPWLAIAVLAAVWMGFACDPKAPTPPANPPKPVTELSRSHAPQATYAAMRRGD